MTQGTSSSGSGQQVNEVKKETTFEQLDEDLTVDIELRPGQNRLVIRVRRSFVFSM